MQFKQINDRTKITIYRFVTLNVHCYNVHFWGKKYIIGTNQLRITIAIKQYNKKK